MTNMSRPTHSDVIP